VFVFAALVAALWSGVLPGSGRQAGAMMAQWTESPTPSVDTATQAQLRALEFDLRVQRALRWLRQSEDDLTATQIRITETPSQDHRAALRGRLFAKLLRDAGLRDVRTDDEGNVLAVLPGQERSERVVVLSAHLDTVFPELDSVRVERQGNVLRGPGVGDDAAGLAAVVYLARALREARVPLRRDLVVVGTVGEEGEGDLRGVKHLFAHHYPPERVHAFLTLDLGSHQQIVNEGLGSRRLHVAVRGPGGHSWGDFGRPNPIHALSRGIDAFLQMPLPKGSRSSFNVGVIEGGSGVNVIPERASVRVDLRSESPALLAQMEADFLQALESGLQREREWAQDGAGLALEVQVIGDRPVGRTASDSPLVRTLVAAFAMRGVTVALGNSSTDANLPMSLGVPAAALPHGVQGHDAHSLSEWCDISGREAVLAAELVALVALGELWGPPQPGPAPTD
jgi:acetylornithine deacetylase/succinyl-diaminopimelate desuccinylase-like protein